MRACLAFPASGAVQRWRFLPQGLCSVVVARIGPSGLSLASSSLSVPLSLFRAPSSGSLVCNTHDVPFKRRCVSLLIPPDAILPRKVADRQEGNGTTVTGTASATDNCRHQLCNFVVAILPQRLCPAWRSPPHSLAADVTAQAAAARGPSPPPPVQAPPLQQVPAGDSRTPDPRATLFAPGPLAAYLLRPLRRGAQSRRRRRRAATPAPEAGHADVMVPPRITTRAES